MEGRRYSCRHRASREPDEMMSGEVILDASGRILGTAGARVACKQKLASQRHGGCLLLSREIISNSLHVSKLPSHRSSFPAMDRPHIRVQVVSRFPRKMAFQVGGKSPFCGALNVAAPDAQKSVAGKHPMAGHKNLLCYAHPLRDSVECVGN